MEARPRSKGFLKHKVFLTLLVQNAMRPPRSAKCCERRDVTGHPGAARVRDAEPAKPHTDMHGGFCEDGGQRPEGQTRGARSGTPCCDSPGLRAGLYCMGLPSSRPG